MLHERRRHEIQVRRKRRALDTSRRKTATVDEYQCPGFPQATQVERLRPRTVIEHEARECQIDLRSGGRC